jgi:Ca-activated chloride channel family protein
MNFMEFDTVLHLCSDKNIFMKHIFLLNLFFLPACLFSQRTGTLQGQITGESSREPQIGVKVMLIQPDTSSTNGWKFIGGAMSDLDGNYRITPLQPGTYTVSFSSIEFGNDTIHKVLINDIAITNLNHHFAQELPVHLEAVLVKSAMRVPNMQVSMVQLRGSRGKVKMNRENYSKIDDHAYVSVASDPLSTFSIDVDRASYSNVRRFLNDGVLPPPDAVRIEEMLNYFPYEYPVPNGKDPVSISSTYTTCPWNPAHQLVHIGLRAKDIDVHSAPANNLVFLMDVSGSMSDANKLPLLKKALYLLVDQLREQDKVSIVVYAGAAGIVLPTTSGANKQAIKDVIEELDAGGSTAGGEGIQLAYTTALNSFITNGNNRVILATDGDFNVGISSEGELIRLIESKRDQGVFLSVLGFGIGNLQDGKMEKLADRGNGNYNYIDNELEAKKVLIDEMGGTLVTVAKDVKLQVEFNPTHVKAYRLIGYENRDLEDEDFNNDSKDAGDMGAGHMVTALYELIPAGSTEVIAGIDSLKYQKEKTIKTDASLSNELMTVKVRYKNPSGASSQLLTTPIAVQQTAFNACSSDLQFACAVAAFGMILRNSEFKGEANLTMVKNITENNKGTDPNGYRADFVELVEKAEKLVGKK